MNKKVVFRFSLFATFVAFFSLATLSTSKNGEYIAVEAYQNNDAATYYANIDYKLIGTELLTSLQSLNATKRQRLIYYDNMSSYFSITDPGTRNGQVTAYYSGKSASFSGNMNREHVWPFSKLVINTGERGQNDIENDMHMIRPALKDDNEGRGNSFFTNPSGAGWDPGSLGDYTYRGDAARIIFYCVVADPQLSLVDKDFDNKDNHTMGKLSTLLKWNVQYSVTSREITRNEAVEGLQGNRNPFIDHPEYACRIWGKYNSETEKICANYFKEPEITIDYTSLRLRVGNEIKLTATITPEEHPDKTVIWESSDESIATVSSNGNVRLIKAGEVSIKAYVSDKSKYAECKIVVIGDTPVTPEEPENPTSQAKCGGSIVATSVILSTISLLGVSLILLRKKKQ